MKNQEAKTIISEEIFKNMILSIEKKLNSNTLKNEVKYNPELNKSLKSDFDQITKVLQNVVDKFYLNNYIVDSFMPLFLEDLEFCVNHNLNLLKSMKKVLKFIK